MFERRKEPDAPNLLRATGASDDDKLVVALSMLRISSGNCLERRKLAEFVTKSRPVSGDLGAKKCGSTTPEPKPYGRALVVPDSWR